MYFLAIQHTYHAVHMSIGTPEGLGPITTLDKTQASKDAISAVAALLKSHQLTLDDLAFIAVNQGPGPFTTLRVVISTVNGLSFARKIPLIGVNGLQAFTQEYPAPNKVILLNAFAGDVYYLIETDGTQTFGSGAVKLVLDEVMQKIPHDQILFLGNGTILHEQLIKDTFGARAQFDSPIPETASLAAIARQGIAQWQAQENISYQLQPLYFKPAFK